MDVLPVLQEISTTASVEQRTTLRAQLAAYLNELLLHDFHTLVQLLYRVDVSEKKLKAVLEENPTEDAGNLLADLLIERQQEKIALRNRFRFPPGASDEERW